MNTVTKLERIAWLSSQDRNKTFACIMHHINIDLLRDNFRRLDGNKAKGIDGVSKAEYGENLEENLNTLLDELKRMAYKPRPVKEHLIPKDGQPGKFRPLGISVLEDKIVQGAFRRILEAIYEPLFLDCSHGFRPKRGCHTAIKDLRKYLYENNVETVIDIDLKNFFGTIDHKILEGFLREKITDERFIRYIIRMFKAGVLSDGDLTISEEGVPQGSICSPILSNIFAHKVLDEWIEHIIRPYCLGKVKLFRYADDAIICIEKESDAIRVRETLPKRLDKYKLKLNEEKTKMVKFSRVKVQKGIHQETFNFLGFTFYWGKTRKGIIVPKLKTSSKTIDTKLKNVTEWIKNIRSKARMKEIWGTFCAKLRGHVQYYGVSFNSKQIQKFHYEATRLVYKWLNRRSQKKSFSWEKFLKFMERFPLPKARICHTLY
jgi:RNA-directed DNA polymerase